MRSLVVALASALLLAVVVTEFIQRLWPESYLALLVTTAVVLFINGIFNQRVAGKPANGGAAPAHGGQDRRNANRTGKAAGGRDRDQKRDQNREPNRDSNNDRGKDRGSRSNNRTADQPTKAAPVPEGPRETGEVKWFNRSKGFGFIIRDSGDEIFVHQRSIRGGGDDGRGRPVLRDGEPVEFVVTEHDKGLQAEDVVPTNRT